MISVIIPVFNQVDLTLNCIESVLSARVDQEFRLIVIDDCSTDSRMEKELARLGSDSRVQMFRHSENLGFTKTANEGILLASRDSHPLLLNSDTIVYDNWLDALHGCLMSGQKVASVTPLTNQRGSHISCYPHSSWSDIDFPELEDRTLAELAYLECRDAAVDVHTGVGFCMLINRAAIEAVGLFDAIHFPRGYGEESDFCYRTRGIGWRHLVCGGTFVTHLHAQSFGAEKMNLRNDMMTVFRRLHPSQPATDADFRATDPVRIVRQQLDIARLKALINTRSKDRIIPVYEKGAASSDPVWLEVEGRCAVFRVRGSEIGVPNIEGYRLPSDFQRLISDLIRLKVSALRFVGQHSLAAHCVKLGRELRIETRVEEHGEAVLLTI